MENVHGKTAFVTGGASGIDQALIRLNLFSYRNLWDWLNDPFKTPSIYPARNWSSHFRQYPKFLRGGNQKYI